MSKNRRVDKKHCHIQNSDAVTCYGILLILQFHLYGFFYILNQLFELLNFFFSDCLIALRGIVIEGSLQNGRRILPGLLALSASATEFLLFSHCPLNLVIG